MAVPIPQTLGQVDEFDPADFVPAPGNRLINPADVADLLPTMGDPTIGQKQAGMVYENPDPPPAKRWCCAAGNRRLMACRILGIKFKAIRIHGPVTPLDIIKIRLTENVLRKAMSPREIAADIEQYMALAKVTQAEAAEHFGFSPAKVSKLLSLKNLASELHPLVDSGKLCGDVARIIASLPTHDLQKELAKRAIENNWKRDAVEREAVRFRGTNKRLPKVKDKKIKDGPLSLCVPGDWSLARIGEALAELVKKVRSGSIS